MKHNFRLTRLFVLAATIFAGPVQAETVVPTHTIRAQTVLAREDLMVKSVTVPGAYSSMEEILGLETRVALYSGRPVRPGDVGPPAVIERNQIVSLVYFRGGLQISTEGRALMRGGVGDRIRVMNLSSRNTVTGNVQQSGSVVVSQ